MPVGNENTVVEVAIASVAEPNKYVVLSNILEGVDNANRFVFSSEDMGVQKILDGVEVPTGLTQSLNIAGYVNAVSEDTNILDFLQNLNDGASVEFTARTLGGDFIQGFNFKVVKKNVFPQNGRHFYNLVFTKDVYGEGYIDNRKRCLVYSKNLIEVNNYRAGNGTRLYGFSGSVNITESESGGVQSMTRLTDVTTTNLSLTRRVLFPFVGTVIKFSVIVSNVTGADGLISIRLADKDNALISLESLTIPTTTTGVQELSVIIPPSTVYVNIQLRPNQAVGATMNFTMPYLGS
jgi:hypothetical protein